MEENKIFSTRDLYLAATLVTLKFYLTGIDYVVEGNKNQPVGFFKFENTPSIQECKSKYTQGLLSVEPKLFISNLKSLKSEIVNSSQNPHADIGPMKKMW
jgi:hypothetical protein